MEQLTLELVDTGMSGNDGSARAPNAPISTSAVIVPWLVDSTQQRRCSSHAARRTSQPKMCRSNTPVRLATPWM
jgi:hypothetical protein